MSYEDEGTEEEEERMERKTDLVEVEGASSRSRSEERET